LPGSPAFFWRSAQYSAREDESTPFQEQVDDRYMFSESADEVSLVPEVFDPTREKW